MGIYPSFGMIADHSPTDPLPTTSAKGWIKGLSDAFPFGTLRETPRLDQFPHGLFFACTCSETAQKLLNSREDPPFGRRGHRLQRRRCHHRPDSLDRSRSRERRPQIEHSPPKRDHPGHPLPVRHLPRKRRDLDSIQRQRPFRPPLLPRVPWLLQHQYQPGFLQSSELTQPIDDKDCLILPTWSLGNILQRFTIKKTGSDRHLSQRRLLKSDTTLSEKTKRIIVHPSSEDRR